MVVGRGLRLTVIGVVLGLVASVVASRFVVSFLYGIEPTDALTFVTVPLALLAVAYLSSLVPARRAARIDPVCAIRAE